MHLFRFPPDLVARNIAKRGSRHSFRQLAAVRTALLVIDLQNAYMLAGTAHALIPEALNIVPNVNDLAAALRSKGGTVAWVQNTVTKDSLAEWKVNEELSSADRRAVRIAALSPGSKGHALWSGLAVSDADLIVQKTRQSAFIQGSSNLEQHLRARDIDTVIVTGTNTGVCCDSTARDAMMRGFRTIMVSDANAALDDEQHSAALIAFYRNFGDVMTTAETLGFLESGGAV